MKFFGIALLALGLIGCSSSEVKTTELVLSPNSPISVASQWVVTPHYKRVYEIPQQRSRPIVVGDILYFADIKGKVSAFHRTGGYVLWSKQLEAGVEGAIA